MSLDPSYFVLNFRGVWNNCRVFIPEKIKRAENWSALKATRYFSLLYTPPVEVVQRKRISKLFYGELHTCCAVDNQLSLKNSIPDNNCILEIHFLRSCLIISILNTLRDVSISIIVQTMRTMSI